MGSFNSKIHYVYYEQITFFNHYTNWTQKNDNQYFANKTANTSEYYVGNIM